MSGKSEFHAYLIKTVVALFVSPIAVFVLLIKLDANERLAFVIAIAIFVYIMFFISMKTLSRYSKRKVKTL